LFDESVYTMVAGLGSFERELCLRGGSAFAWVIRWIGMSQID